LKPTGKNIAADVYRSDLLEVANGVGPAKLRALAIRALGRGVPGAPAAEARRWFKDRDPLIRQAALVLLADSPGEATTKLIAAGAKDASAEVRIGAARAVGFGQFKGLIPVLGGLLKDESAPVRKAAAMSLLSFAPEDAGKVLKANLGSDFRSLFANALARKDPKPYLAILTEIIERKLEPHDFWGGLMPAQDSWEILFKFIRAQPANDLQTGKLDPTLDALEKLRWGDSSRPRDLYALYLVKGLPQRAKRFREDCKRNIGFNMEYFFEMVDKNPSTYVRNE
jgi:hypothetical protein